MDCAQCGAPCPLGGQQSGARGLCWAWCSTCGCVYVERSDGSLSGFVPAWSRSRLAVPPDAVAFVVRTEDQAEAGGEP